MEEKAKAALVDFLNGHFQEGIWYNDDFDEIEGVAFELAECGDTLPAEYCSLLDIPRGSSYADAALELAEHDEAMN